MGAIENIRRLVPGGNEAEEPYECRRCGQQYARQRQVCPKCEGFSIERAEW